MTFFKKWLRGFPGGAVVENLPANAGDTGSSPGWGTKIPYTVGQLGPSTATTEPVRCNKRSHMPQLRPDAAKNR